MHRLTKARACDRDTHQHDGFPYRYKWKPRATYADIFFDSNPGRDFSSLMFEAPYLGRWAANTAAIKLGTVTHIMLDSLLDESDWAMRSASKEVQRIMQEAEWGKTLESSLAKHTQMVKNGWTPNLMMEHDTITYTRPASSEQTFTLEALKEMLDTFTLPKIEPTIIHCDVVDLKKALVQTMPHAMQSQPWAEDAIPYRLLGVPIHNVPKGCHWCSICERPVK